MESGPGPDVVLLTRFDPSTGGGGSIVRSLLSQLRDVHRLTVEWMYLGSELPASGQGSAHRLGPELVPPGWRGLPWIPLLWSGLSRARVEAVADELADRRARTYWVVGDMEAVLVASELSRRGLRVHLTMHDDLAHGQFARSRKLRGLTRLADRQLGRAMRAADSRDVVCAGMGAYYLSKFDVDSVVVHRYLEPLTPAPRSAPDGKDLVVGHIGSLYSVAEFAQFCSALQQFATRQGLAPKVVMVGRPIEEEALAPFRSMLEFTGHLDESAAVDLLSGCSFLYAMYPFDDRMRVFRTTSSPTKLTTYLMAQRPVFAHTPEDSSLHALVTEYDLGVTCASTNAGHLFGAIERLALKSTGDVTARVSGQYQRARDELHGEQTVAALAVCLSGAPDSASENG